MVKKKFILPLSVLMLFFSCSKYEIARDDTILEYQNYSNERTLSLDSIRSIGIIINEYPLSANKFDSLGLIEIKGKTKELLSNECNFMKDNYRRIQDGCDYIKFIPEEYAEHFYYCGKLKLNNNVESLLFLYKYDLGVEPSTFEVLPMNELIVLNFKNNNLSSVVSLSRELSKSEIMPSVTQKANKYLFYYIYNLDESVQNNIFYTSFYIDDCGYVRFQWFPEEEIHQIINGNF